MLYRSISNHYGPLESSRNHDSLGYWALLDLLFFDGNTLPPSALALE